MILLSMSRYYQSHTMSIKPGSNKPSINKTPTTSNKPSSKKIPKDDGPKAKPKPTPKLTSKLTSEPKSTSKPKNESSDVMDALMTTSIFDAPSKQKITEKGPLKKDIEIDLEKDSQEDIIRKLVLNIKNLRAELDEHKIYSDGTFCTQSVHNRSIYTLEKKVEDLTTIVDDLA